MRARGKATKHGSRWRIRPIGPDGKRISLTFASKEEAELELARLEINTERERLGLALIPATPVHRPQAALPDKSFNDLCDYWIKNRVPEKRSGSDDESIIRAHLRPMFGALSLRELGTEHIDNFKLRQRRLDKQTLNNHLKLLISMLNVAMELKWILERPKIKKPKLAKYDKSYRYLKTQDEVNRFLIAAKEESNLVHALYATAVYTGLRLGELAALDRASVDFDKRLIMVKNSFHTETKTGEIRFVPILDPLLPVLKRWFVTCPGGRVVFPNAHGRMHLPSARVFQETLHRVLARAGFPRVEFKGKLRWYVRFHDLRHTFASHWAMSGGDMYRLQKILGHQTAEMTQRYAHLSPDVFVSDYARMGSDAAAGFVIGSVLKLKSDGRAVD